MAGSGSLFGGGLGTVHRIGQARLLGAFHLGDTAFMDNDLDGSKTHGIHLAADDFDPRFSGEVIFNGVAHGRIREGSGIWREA